MKYIISLTLVTALGLLLVSMPVQAMHHGKSDGSGNKGKMFEKLDADGDGSVTQEEAQAFQSGRKEVMKKKMKDKMQEKRQERMEKRNGDSSSNESAE